MRFGRVFFLLPLLVLFLVAPVFSQVASKDCPQVFLDTSSAFHLLKDIAGEDLKGTARNEGGRRMFGTLTVGNPCLVPFILRMTFDNGGAFRIERKGFKALIGMQELELRYRDRSEVSLSKKFSRTLSRGGEGGYVYEIEFLQEDMQAVYRMELWGFVNDRDARRASGGIYRETINFEVESRYVRPEKAGADDAVPDDGGMPKRRRRR